MRPCIIEDIESGVLVFSSSVNFYWKEAFVAGSSTECWFRESVLRVFTYGLFGESTHSCDLSYVTFCTFGFCIFGTD
jgi:hypothetical protein